MYDIQSGVALDPGHEMAVDAELRKLEGIRDQARGRSDYGMARRFQQAAEDLPRLFDLAVEDVLTLSDLTLAYGQEVDPDDEKAVQRKEEAVARLAAQFVDNDELVIRKVERYIHVLETQDMMVTNFKARAKRLRDHAAAIEKGQDHLKARLLAAMQVMKRESVATPAGVVSTQQNPPAVKVWDASLIPAEFMRTKVEVAPDLNAIKAHVKLTHTDVPGTTVERATRLVVS